MTTVQATARIKLDGSGVAPEAARIGKAIGGIGQAGQVSARQTAAAMRQLPAQFTDIATQLAGGQNPLLILLQQGGQIKDSFGGVRAAVAGVASAINPAVLGLGAAAVAASALAAAAFQGAKDSARLRDSLVLSGNAAGVTATSLATSAERISAASGQTIGSARAILQQLVSSGQVTTGVIDSTALAIARLSDLTGQAADSIAGKFANQLREPAKVAAELNRQYNFLSVEQAKRIKQLDDEGFKVSAVNETNRLLTEALAQQRLMLSGLERAYEGASKAASEFWGDLTSALGGIASVRQQVREIDRELALSRGETGSWDRFFDLRSDSQKAEVEARLMARRSNLLRTLNMDQLRAVESAAQLAATSDKVAGILDSDRPRPRGGPRAPQPRRIDEQIGGAAKAALDLINDTNGAKIAAVSEQLDKLFEYRATGLFGPEIEGAIDRLRDQLADLKREAAVSALPLNAGLSAAQLQVVSFLQAEKAGYEETDRIVRQAAERANKVKSLGEELKDVFGGVKSEFEDAALAGRGLGSVLQGLAQDLARMLLRRYVSAPLFDAIGSAIGSFLPGAPSYDAGGAGGAFALGGVVDRATPFAYGGGRRGVMGEAGPEGILPLRRGRNGVLGVVAQGGAGDVHVNVLNMGAPVQAEAATRRTPQGVVVDLVLRAMAADVRAGGTFDRALRTTYPTLSRAAGAPRMA